MNNLCDICHIKEPDFAEHINTSVSHIASTVSYCTECWLKTHELEENDE